MNPPFSSPTASTREGLILQLRLIQECMPYPVGLDENASKEELKVQVERLKRHKLELELDRGFESIKAAFRVIFKDEMDSSSEEDMDALGEAWKKNAVQKLCDRDHSTSSFDVALLGAATTLFLDRLVRN